MGIDFVINMFGLNTAGGLADFALVTLGAGGALASAANAQLKKIKIKKFLRVSGQLFDILDELLGQRMSRSETIQQLHDRIKPVLAGVSDGEVSEGEIRTCIVWLFDKFNVEDYLAKL